jgi:putative redox protein
MKTLLKYLDGHTFVAKSDSNHWIPLDTGEKSGGSAAASDPFQLLTIAATGCCAIDVVDILKKSRKEIRALEIETEIERVNSVPKVLRSLHFHLRVHGEEFTPDQIRRAIELSLTKYCSVALSLDRSVRFSAQFTLNGVTSEPWNIQRELPFTEQS